MTTPTTPREHRTAITVNIPESTMLVALRELAARPVKVGPTHQALLRAVEESKRLTQNDLTIIVRGSHDQ